VASGHAQELEAARADARQQLSDLDVVKSEQRRALARLEKRVTELTTALSRSEETNATTSEGLRLQLSQRERELADVEAQLELVRRENQRRLQEQEASLKQVRRRLQAAEREAEAAQLTSRDKAAPAVDAAEVARLKKALEAARAQAATEEGKLRRARDEAEARLCEREALFEAERGDFALRQRSAEAREVSLRERMAQMNARLEESNNARSRLSAQLQAMAEAGRRRPLSEADDGLSVWALPYRAKGGLVGAGVGSGGDSGMSMADETPVMSNGGGLMKNKGVLSYGGNGQPTGFARGSSVEREMNGGPHSPTLLIEKQMVLDSRNRQLELELEKALAARQRAAEEFQQRLQAMRRQLDESEAERLKFAQQLRLITVDGLLGNNGDADYDLKNLNGKTHLLINRKFELSSNSRSEATTREYDLY
jgi:chromosome segregation ATPase